jgi:hypothetical protein
LTTAAWQYTKRLINRLGNPERDARSSEEASIIRPGSAFGAKGSVEERIALTPTLSRRERVRKAGVAW